MVSMLHSYSRQRRIRSAHSQQQLGYLSVLDTWGLTWINGYPPSFRRMLFIILLYFLPLANKDAHCYRVVSKRVKSKAADEFDSDKFRLSPTAGT